MSGRQSGTVQTAHAVQYPDPITMRKGDVLTLDGRRDNWQGHIWVWCIHADGKSGWVPDSFIDETGNTATARADYNAIELAVEAGETITVLQETNGWYWCENAGGRQGWVPTEKVDVGVTNQE